MNAYRILICVFAAAIAGQVQISFAAAADGAKKPVLKQTKISNSGVDVSYVRVSPQDFDVRVLTASVSGDAQFSKPLYSDRLASGYSLQDYQNRYGAFVVLSGGYIDSYSPPTPLGLVKSNGIQIGAVQHSWLVDGFFCSDVEHVAIVPVNDDATLVASRDCVQSGPLLLLGQKRVIDPAREGLAEFKNFEGAPQERTFACLAGNGDVIIGLTGKIDLQKLVLALLEPEFNCKDAIAFMGSESAGLRVGDTLLGADDLLFPSAIAVMPRTAGPTLRPPSNAR